MISNLYIVATPIGNLSDMTFRAIETLKTVDAVLCEDTRVTAKLLNHYEIKKPLISYHQHSKLSQTEKIIEMLKEGKSLALVTDAGTPGISDPGGKLVAEVQEKLGEDVKIESVPGPSALTAFISISGEDFSKFTFLGFPPNKKGREKFFKEVLISDVPVIYYESKYRLIKNLELLQELAGQQLAGEQKLKIIVGGELTKVFEKMIKGSTKEVLEYFKEDEKRQKGEFVVGVIIEH